MPKSKLAIVPVDIQVGFRDQYVWGGARNNPAFEENVARIFDAARDASVPIIHVKHNSTDPDSPLRPGQAGNEFMDIAAPNDGEQIFEKTVNCGFVGTHLEKALIDQAITDLIIFGLTTDQCVSTTTRLAANLGFSPRIAEDACATFPKKLPNGQMFDAQTIHNTNLASLNEEFCTIYRTDDALEEILAYK